MTVWCTISTIFKQRHGLRIAGLLTLSVALTTTLLFGFVSHAAPGINQTINFQGRLQYPTGGVVADGHYNIQFKIYQGGDGQSAGNTTGSPSGSLKWTESRINNGGTSGVDVKNGYFTVDLGSVTPFSGIDWNDDTLWLSMNIAGSATGCTTFGSSPCTADGEMLPMQRLTAVPYAINSSQLGGKTAQNFVQLSQGSQTDSANSSSSIFINKTGTGGNFLRLQGNGSDLFSLTSPGDIAFGNQTDHSISITASDAGIVGRSLALQGGTGGSGSGSIGGNVTISGGNAGGTNANGGNIILDAGNKSGTGNDGSILIGTLNSASVEIGNSTLASGTQTITIGNNNTSGGTTNIAIGTGGSASGGYTDIMSKDDTTVSTNGTQRARFSGNGDTLYLGNADDTGIASTANGFTIQGTSSNGANVQGGSITLLAGSATSGNANGGNINISGGDGIGTGAKGLVVINTPTFQATTNDTNCYTSGALVASSCTFASASVDGSSVLITGFSATGRVATLPDPTIATAGRIVYVTAANTSKEFILRANTGAGVGIEQNIVMNQNTTATLIWNGSDWTVAGAFGDASLFSMNSDGNADHIPNIQVGDGSDSGTPTLLSLDKATSAPTVTDDVLLGSMYYDTTLGKVQCYEADGWGACGAAPDTFITLSPEYANAVMNGNDIGTITSDLCSDTLNINDGSSGQPTICGTNETFNFYKWTSSQTSNQVRGIYITYQLPSNFKEFISGSTSLKGRTDSADSAVTYQIYRNNSSGLTSCGSAISVSTGSQSTWQTGTASGGADPSGCGFQAGESVLIRINLTSKDNANAYVSNLNFTYSNQ